VARYRGPVGKVSRRLGFGITEKGERILQKRSYAPGMHGPNARQKKVSDYGIRLAEKQKAKYIYGLLEKQFRRTFEFAKKEPGETGVALFSLLERRLDNVVYRLGYGKTRAQARQLVSHGHFTVNGRKTDIPSMTVKVGDVIAVRAESRKASYFKALAEGSDLTRRGPGWLSVSGGEMTATVLSVPRREDAEQGINEQLIVEYYSR
jgi:small subunit ribosomal protein S4